MMPASAITFLAVTTVAATAIGAFVVGRGFAFRHEAVRWAVCTATGLLLLSALVFLLSLGGVANAGNLRILFAVLVMPAVIRTVHIARHVRPRDIVPSNVRTWVGWWAAAAIAYLAWIVLVAMLPPLATDELNHHLAVPRAMLASGGRVFFPDNIYAYFPPLGEMLFLFGLGVAGETAARLFQVPFALVVGAALYGFSRSYVPAWAAVWAVAIFFAVPSVMVNLPTAYVDVIFTAYALLALLMLVEYFETHLLRWAALSGALAAGALATKYSGIQLLLLLALLLLIEHLVARRKGLPVAVGALAGAAFPIVLPILARNFALTGWPLFPFPTGPLPLAAAINWDGDRASMFLTLLASYGSGASPIGPARMQDALAAPVLVFLLGRFDDPRLYDGIVGPVFLLTPFVLWRTKRSPATIALALFAVIFVGYWALTIRQVRFLIPVLAVMSVLLALGLWQQRRRALWVIAGACVLVNAGIGIRRVLDRAPLPFWTGAETRDAYLTRRLSVYAIYDATNRRLGETDRVYLVNMRNLGFYLDVPWRGDFVFETFHLERELESGTPAGLRAFYRSQGITHLLIDEHVVFSSGVLRPHAAVALRQFLQQDAVMLEHVEGQALYRIHE
jgi:hypothetical protein